MKTVPSKLSNTAMIINHNDNAEIITAGTDIATQKFIYFLLPQSDE